MEKLEFGYVARAHGVRGEVRVHLHALGSTTLFDVERAWVGGVERKIVSARENNGAVLLTLEGVDGRDAADALRGAKVEVDRTAVSMGDNEYLLADLPGCEVVDTAGAVLGRVVEVIPGAQDLLVIHDDTSERILPAVPDFVHTVDLAARRITVTVPDGLPVEPKGQR